MGGAHLPEEVIQSIIVAEGERRRSLVAPPTRRHSLHSQQQQDPWKSLFRSRRTSLEACASGSMHGSGLRYITELCVADSKGVPGLPTIPQWLDILRETPRIQTLSIRDAVKPSQFDVSLTKRQISLPSLRMIALEEAAAGSGQTFALLAAIVPSRTCGLLLRLPRVVDETCLSLLENALNGRFSVTQTRPGVHKMPLCITVSKECELAISNVRDPVTPDQDESAAKWRHHGLSPSSAHTFLRIHVPGPTSHSFWDMQRILKDVLYPRITSLHLAVHPDATMLQIKAPNAIVPLVPLLLQNMTEVQSLTFHGERSLLPLIICLKEWESGFSNVIPVLPYLERLVLRDFDHIPNAQLTSFLDWRASVKFGVRRVCVAGTTKMPSS